MAVYEIDWQSNQQSDVAKMKCIIMKGAILDWLSSPLFICLVVSVLDCRWTFIEWIRNTLNGSFELSFLYFYSSVFQLQVMRV